MHTGTQSFPPKVDNFYFLKRSVNIFHIPHDKSLFFVFTHSRGRQRVAFSPPYPLQGNPFQDQDQFLPAQLDAPGTGFP